MEFQLAFNAEMFDGQMFFPIVGQGFVKFAIFLLRNVIGVTGPDGFCLVQFLIFGVFFLDGFLLFLVFVSFVFVFVFSDIFNFGLVISALLFVLFHFLLLGFVVRNFLIAFLLNQKFDGITNELGVFLNHILGP